MTDSTVAEVFPGNLRQATSIFIAGTSRPLLKWVAFALLERYASRVYWTDIRYEGEAADPLDPLVAGVIPADRVHVLNPRQLHQDESLTRRVEAAAPSLLRTDEPAESVRRIFDFLRLPAHTQERIASTFSGDEPALLVLANGQRLGGTFPPEAVAPIVHAIVDAGACIVTLWAEALPAARGAFDVVLHVQGQDPSGWRTATLRCEKGLSTGPLAHGVTVSLSDLPTVAAVLESRIPPPKEF
jgi:hypothetical protein